MSELYSFFGFIEWREANTSYVQAGDILAEASDASNRDGDACASMGKGPSKSEGRCLSCLPIPLFCQSVNQRWDG